VIGEGDGGLAETNLRGAAPCTSGRCVERPVTVSVCAQAKLEHYLPTATDSVLCDYVLVMVGNKKNSRQVALDLEVSPRFAVGLTLFCRSKHLQMLLIVVCPFWAGISGAGRGRGICDMALGSASVGGEQDNRSEQRVCEACCCCTRASARGAQEQIASEARRQEAITISG
jgi:hypothetical protein